MPRNQHPLEIHGIDTILEDGVDVRDLEVKDLLIITITVLRKIEFHLSILSETEITDQDIGD